MKTWILELFGPSAVGKSTLLRHYLGMTDRVWLTRSELEAHGIGQPDAMHETFFVQKGRAVMAQADTPMLERAARIQRLSQILSTDVAARDLLPKGSFLDEGLAHHLGGYLQQAAAENAHSFASFMKHRAYVQLTGAPKTILPRVKKRLADNPWCGTYSSFPDEEAILTYLERSVVNHIKMAQFMSSLGCPIITLDIERDLSEQLKTLVEFVEGLNACPPGSAGSDKHAPI